MPSTAARLVRLERIYTDAEKGTALALCDLHAGRTGAHDKGIAAASRAAGVPRQTLTEWHAARHVSADVPHIRQEKKAALVSMMTEAVAQLIGGITLDKIAAAKLPEITTAAGTLIDKALLLSGEATGRSESRTLNLSASYQHPPPHDSRVAAYRDRA